MKARPTIFARLLVGAAVVLVSAAAFWRFGGSAILQERTERESAVAAGADGQRALKHRSNSSADRVGSSLNEPEPAAEPSASPAMHALLVSLQALELEADALERENKLETLLSGVTSNDIPASVEFLHKQKELEVGRDLQLRLIRQWTENDPRAAADWVSKKATGKDRQNALKGVATVWANQNLADATEWAQQLPDGERDEVLLSVAYEAARTEPLQALELARSMPADEARDELVTHTVTQWATREPEAAATWAKQIEDATLRARVLADVATTWGETDPVAAATLALESIPSGKQQEDAFVGIVQRWVQNQPEAAAAWVIEFPEGKLQETALVELVKLWADQDLAQPGSWLNGLASGISRDVAIESYAGKLAPQFPELALLWVTDIADETLRQRGMESVAETWLALDASAAGQWITQSPLTETAKTRLLH